MISLCGIEVVSLLRSGFSGGFQLFGGCAYLRLFFAYTIPMWNLPAATFCDYTIRCKRCAENIPAPVRTMPDTWIIAACPLCGQSCYYLPTDIFRGRLSFLLRRKPVRSERGVY